MQKFKFPKIPFKFYLFALIYFIASVFLHWRLQLTSEILIYLLGALIGIHLLEITENILNTKETFLFKSVLVQFILWIMVFFAMTSSIGILGKGVVLFMNLRLWYMQYDDVNKTGSLANWLNQVNISFNSQQTNVYLWIATIIVIIQTVLFILV